MDKTWVGTLVVVAALAGLMDITAWLTGAWVAWVGFAAAVIAALMIFFGK